MDQDLTPMMKQYRKLKQQTPDALLFFRLGDFYEMFEEDALIASKELQITLTGRGQGEKRAPMCGVPYHSVNSYLSKLLSKGYKVAICEQVEDPSLAKGIVERDIVKIITPGTILEDFMLNHKASNYLMAVSFANEKISLAYADVSTGEFKTLDIEDDDKEKILFDEIERISPSEILIAFEVIEKKPNLINFLQSKNIVFTPYHLRDIFDVDVAREKLLRHFKVGSLEGFGFSGNELSLCVASAIIDYLKSTQKNNLSHINLIKKHQINSYMHIDASTKRNLELLQTIKDRNYQGSLLWILDNTLTPMGGRLLRNWLVFPLKDVNEINLRLDAVDELVKKSQLRHDLENALSKVYDIERIVGKLSSSSGNARDLISLKDSISELPVIKEILLKCESKLFRSLADFSDFKDIFLLIDSAIVNDPPSTLKEGGIIKKGYNEELDSIKEDSLNAKKWISNLEEEEKTRTGIKSLKVGFTKVFGYYIEVTTPNLKYVPPEYIRKQTLVNCERFITPELKEKESLILNADSRAMELEYSLFCEIRDKVASHSKELQHASHCIAVIDALLSLANVAVKENYTKPEVVQSDSDLIIKDGRHPVAEKTLGKHFFVPNDTFMNESSRFLLITGPNMAGKSTYMRQVALIVLLSQIGSFVPAAYAKIPVCDRIFTRVGSFDDLYMGQSTFMVEMLETANIINNATKDSLIIIDEIGRGTATFDGMSIAKAIAEYICENIGAKTLFATHYHELTSLSQKFASIKNLNVAVKEEGDNVIFLHKILDGPADKSYGIHVAKIAGLPEKIIQRAKEIYNSLEMVENNLE